MLEIIAQRLSDNQFEGQGVLNCQMLQQGRNCPVQSAVEQPA